ncbi:MAG TPA: RNA degradosome polyphosphate kinase [Mycobacteriales bacterium]|nr:RNA degradosome polyphosphate kinase [Mycobacteriales bacterium]
MSAETAAETAAGADPQSAESPASLPEHRYVNRELSWLAFNARVLELAADPATPLLERAKFLAIFESNLDEFFMVRVAGLRRRVEAGLGAYSADGMSPKEQLDAISRRAHELVGEHRRVFTDEVLPALVAVGVDILRWDELKDDDRDELHKLFREQVFPVLTPLAVDPAHPFPYISGLSLNLAVVVRDPDTGDEHFARVKVPPLLTRFMRVAGNHFVPLEDVIAAHLDQLFPGMDIVQHHTFRVTRNADLEVDEDETEDLLQALERELLRRRFGPVVRLEVEESMSSLVLDVLKRELDVGDDDVYRASGPLDLSGLWAIHALDRPDLKDPRFAATTHPRLAGGDGGLRDIFEVLRAGDVLLHHPYDSFTRSVQAFVEQAAADPHVLAIKQTLYRTSGDSPIVDALIDAAESGKQVVVVVELQARFDEMANIRWARALEQAGCHVVYGLVGLKTHAKAMLVVRQEASGLRRYAHIGTGNYNPKTARIYEDLGILTANPQVGADLTNLFNHLTGYSRHTDYSRLLVAPHSVRRGVIELFEREVAHHRAGRPARVVIKVNSLVDEQVVDALYRTAQAGVPVDVLVRGMCVLRPGLPGLSESVRVRSILGRFLEHSRILWFANGGDEECWIGSADLMHRNLDRRVEALVRVGEPADVEQLKSSLDLAMSDRIAAWELGPEGKWHRRVAVSGQPLVDYQSVMIKQFQQRSAASA